MQLILIAFFIIPLLAFLFSLSFKNFQEKNISSIAIGASGLHIFLTVGFFINWLIQGHQPVAFTKLVGFLMGQLMKVSQGKADPKQANPMLRKMLDELS